MADNSNLIVFEKFSKHSSWVDLVGILLNQKYIIKLTVVHDFDTLFIKFDKQEDIAMQEGNT